MIKNVKITLGRLCLLFISIIGIYFCNNVNGSFVDSQCLNEPNYGRVYFPCYIEDPGDYISWNGQYNTVFSNLNFNYQSAIDYKAFSIYEDFYNGQRYTLFWNTNGLMDYILDCGSYCNNVRLYSVNQMCVYNGNDYTGAINRCYNTDNGNLYNYSTDSFYQTVVSNKLELLDYVFLPFRIKVNNEDWYIGNGGLLCLHYTNTYYCISLSQYSGQYPRGNLLQEGIATPGNGLEYYSYMFSNSPISSSSSGGGSSEGGSSIDFTSPSLDNTIYYYENVYGWNENACYVGTNDLTSPYGTSGIDFNYGTGDTIFGLFNSIYSGFGDNIVQNVGRFVNTWLINYSQWFATSPSNRTFLASYSGPGNNVTYYYTGLSFPFANNPVAVYFMSDLLFNEYSTSSTQGEEFAYYCYLKLNHDSIEGGSIDFEDVKDQVTPGIIGRIDTYNNEVLKGRVGFLVPDLSGSSWGDVFTGDVFTGDVDPSSTFENMYNGVIGLFRRGNYSGSGILPDWIIYPLLFLILFRILKH